VLRGRIALWLEGEEVVREAGSYTVVPPGQQHTFWNPTDEPAAYLTPIAPAGFRVPTSANSRSAWSAPPPKRKGRPCAAGSPNGTTSPSSRRRLVSEDRRKCDQAIHIAVALA
jgi:hypothetical protein